VAIGRYQDVYWFPDGSLAANVQARVFPLESSALATLYTDATGTVLAPNPLSTNGAGVLTVFAEEGEYWIHIDQRSFRVSVGTPYDVDLFETGVGTLSTGLIAGGEITASLTDPRAIVIPETVGYVVDHSSDPFNPTVTRVHVAAQEAVLVGASLTRNVTWWMLDATGAVVQQEPTPTPEQRRTHIVLGVTAYNPGADLIYIVRTRPGILPQTLNQVNDLMDALGPFSLSGNVVTPNAGLTLSKTSGVMFTRGFRYLEDPDNPHQSTLAAQNPMQFRYGTRNTTVFPLATTTLVDPANYAGTSKYVGAILFNHMAGVNIVRVPYKGTGPALAAVMGGEVHAMFGSAGGSALHLQNGRLRALAVGSEKPSALAPGVPTLQEAGLKGFVSEALHALFAPAGTPPTVVARLNQEVARYLQSAEAQDVFVKAGIEPDPSTPEELTAIMKSEIARIDKVLKAAGRSGGS
jgi:hypothetical protein